MHSCVRRALIPALLLAAACSGEEFSEPPGCQPDCSLPHTNPPVVHWVTPQPTDSLYTTTILFVGASDDKGVDHVEFAYLLGPDWVPVTPGPIQAPPYMAEFGKYVADTNAALSSYLVELRAIAVDVEGNADTVNIELPPRQTP